MQEALFVRLIYWIAGVIFCAFAVERITEIINDSKLFAPLRLWLGKLALRETPSTLPNLLPFYPDYMIVRFVHGIISCSWCLSVWVSLLLCWAVPGEYFRIDFFDNILVKWFVVVGLSNASHDMFTLLYRGRVRTIDLVIKENEADVLKSIELPDEPISGDPHGN